MSRRRPVTPAKGNRDAIEVVESNGSPSKVHPATTAEVTNAKLQEYIHDERHFSFVRYLFPCLFVLLSRWLILPSSLFPSPSPSYPSCSHLHPDSVTMISKTNARNLHMADFVTMINGLCGIMSIFNSLAFCLSHPSDYSYLWKALGFPFAGLLADFFDGKVARWRGKSSLLGQELDSLADLVRIY